MRKKFLVPCIKNSCLDAHISLNSKGKNRKKHMIHVNKIHTDWSHGIPSGLTWYFIGQPKTGKSTQASKWSDKGSNGVILLDTDLGADFIEAANVVPVTSLNPPKRQKTDKDGKKIVKDGKPVIEIVPPEERDFFYRSGANKGTPMPVYSLSEALVWLEKEWTKLPYDTVVIDTIDEVNKWIEKEITELMGISEMGQGEWGSDWGAARKRNVDSVLRFQKMVKRYGGNLVLISHSKTSTMTDGKVQLSPELPRGLGYALTAKADVVGYTTANKSDGKFYVSFKTYDERTIGSRLRPLLQKELLFDYSTIKNEVLSYKEEDINGTQSK